jgi:SH3-like domain-containing protein
MRRVLSVGIIVCALLLVGIVPAAAQGQPDCPAVYQSALTGFMAHCFDAQVGNLCAATDPVEIQMDSGQVVSGAGGAARISGVAVLRLLPGDSWGLASLPLADPVDSQKVVTLLVFGPASLEFQHDADVSAGMSFTLTGSEPPVCGDLPLAGVLVQSPEKTLTLLRVNGIDLAINGMAVIHPLDGGLSVNALSHETILGQTGTVVFAGYGVQVVGGTVSAVAPYDPALVANLPVQILPDMQATALPGNALVLQEMNLFQRPAPEAYTNTLVKAGLPVNIFGRSADDQWLYIRTYDGERGWFPAYVLEMHVPGEIPVLNETPASPVRPFGAVQTYVVTNAEYNNLRAGPGEDFEIVVTVPLWTQLALYGRSQDDQWLLVETAEGVRAWANVVLISSSTPYVLEELPYAPQ